ncbi:Nudix hydrolase 21, chloroplastic [Coelomomyces lativittatus]|nr:Nudix hydrolase 21, chloroplastic [Coelomomyces lativittatus]
MKIYIKKKYIYKHPPPPPPAPRCYRRKKNYGCPPQYPIASPVTSSGFITSHGSGGPPPHGSSLSSSSSSLSSATPSGSEGVPPDLELPEDQRLLLLKGLKTNWEKMNSEYQKLSLTVDTVPKITRKLTIEAQLKQLEEDIQRFSHEKIRIKL